MIDRGAPISHFAVTAQGDESGPISSAVSGVNAPLRFRFSAFVQSLRAHGFAVGLAESHDALRILCALETADKALFLAALRSLFASRRADWENFDALFNAFWFAKSPKGTTKFHNERRDAARGRRPNAPDADSSASGVTGLPDETGDSTGEAPAETKNDLHGRASATESLTKTDFRHILDQEQMQRAYLLANRLAARMRTRLSRRERAGRHGKRLDFRRVIHRSISRGGTPVELVFRRRRTKPIKLVILLDASGSMSTYTPLFVRFMHGAVESFKYAAAFVFHTRLVDVTDAIKDKNPQRAIDRLGLLAEGVGGGTRIGESLATFNARHAARTINSRTAVMIISDGFETGDANLLADAMRALRKRCRRILWLNPLLGWPGYEPKSAGMMAALPYVDLFAPANTLESFEALEPYLARL